MRTGNILDDNVNLLITENVSMLGNFLVDSCTKETYGTLSHSIEKFTEIRLYQKFFETGALASKTEVQPCSDEEYIGAALGFSQELSKYAVNRALEVSFTL